MNNNIARPQEKERKSTQTKVALTRKCDIAHAEKLALVQKMRDQRTRLIRQYSSVDYNNSKGKS